ncbi:MAG: 50S ribosomal protein L18 [Ignisphaera sp.]|nr:50S ribosomal protein L18 [Ignisphaera sp.]MCX8168499.1 50S ribosomal protein L18 [Ignisphaera sp.]MDW8085061.1 50S ribosomal protein L18 [Ignisphaera sp.]
MARGANYKVAKRRRREGKTNYYKRYTMVKTRQIRVVVRKTNKHIYVQFIYPTPVGDYTLAAAHSRELAKLFNWKGDTKNTPAAYLTGLLAGLRAKKLGIENAIPDIGLHRPTKGSKVFAAIKGVIDAKISVPCSNNVLPSDDRISGAAIAEYAKKLIESNPELFEKQFSELLRKEFDPRNIVDHFEQVKNLIIKIYEGIPENTTSAKIISSLTKGV